MMSVIDLTAERNRRDGPDTRLNRRAIHRRALNRLPLRHSSFSYCSERVTQAMYAWKIRGMR